MSDENDKPEPLPKTDKLKKSGNLLTYIYEKGADNLVLGNFIMLTVVLVSALSGFIVPPKVIMLQIPINIVIYLLLPKRIELFIYLFIIHALLVFLRPTHRPQLTPISPQNSHPPPRPVH